MIAVGAASASWARTAAASLLVGALTFGTLMAAMVALAPKASAAEQQSPVTVASADQDPDFENAPFPGLSVTVSQTTNLVSQGIRLTYSGGVRSLVPTQQMAGSNFLQVFQCWGDLKDLATGELILDQNQQPQPDRTTCQYGSTGAFGQTRSATPADANSVPAEDQPYFFHGSGPARPSIVAIPFRSVTGKVLARVVDGQMVPDPPNMENNEFYNKSTTNEVSWAGFDAQGSGTANFEVQTNMQAPGLGCGNPITATDGSVSGQRCWLVVVPRGAHDSGQLFITKSGLIWDNWKHRLAVRLDFKPLGVRCALGAAEQSIVGTELVSAAVGSWQPMLCNGANSSVYNLVVATEADAVINANDAASGSLALTTRALQKDGDSPDNLAYAPIAIASLAVVFAVDRFADPIASDVPDAVKAIDQQPFTQMNLTPRLLAKLLTNSYKASLPTDADLSHLGDNPINITYDPDFLASNPDWRYQALNSPAIGDVLVPLGRSDSAWAIWQYIVADEEARRFLDGTPDPWGMVVNPWASTSVEVNARVNPPGVASELPTDTFPKSDPTEIDLVHDDFGRSNINLVTWRPYASDLNTAGYLTLRGDGKILGVWDGVSNPPKFTSTPREVPGFQKVLGVTDAASASRYQLRTAALRNPAGEFVAPTAASLAAAVGVMVPDAEQPQVYGFDADSEAAAEAHDAYPLTVPVYAAANPDGVDAEARAAYAHFIRYASGDGQVPGMELGQLPPGYAPIPEAWRSQAMAAADLIENGTPEPIATPEPTPTPTPTATPTPTPTFSPASTPPAVLPVSGPPPASQPTPTPTATAGPTSMPVPTPSVTTDMVPPEIGAATPSDTAAGPLGAAVPISAAGGLLAAASVPLVSRFRRAP